MRKLGANDEVLINIVLQHEDGLFARTDKAQLSYNNNLVTYQTVKVPDNQIDVCNAKTWNDNAPILDGRSVSKIYINRYLSRKLYKPNDLIFEENFDTQLDTKIWNYDKFMYSNVNGDMTEEFTMFTDDKDNIAVKGGELLITPTISQRRAKGAYNITGCKGATCYEGQLGICNYKKERNRHYMHPAPVDSARITTNGTFSFTYGRVEISARLPEGDWLIPYIMLQPDKLNCSMRKQLRVAYATSIDLENSRIRGGPVILYARTNPSNQKTIFERTSHMTFHTGIQANKYHNFTLIWTPRQIALYVDKDKYGCFTNNHQYDETYHIVLGVSAGGHLEYADTYSKPWLNGYNNASQTFHQSFQGCCSKGLGDCNEQVPCNGKNNCPQERSRYVQRKCSKPWGPQSAMAVNYVRIYAV